MGGYTLQKNQNFLYEGVTTYAIAEDYEMVERFEYKKGKSHEVLVSNGLLDQNNLFPFINLLSTSFNKVHLSLNGVIFMEDNFTSMVKEQALKILGFELSIVDQEPLYLIDPHSGIYLEVDYIGQLIALLSLCRTSDRKKSESIVAMDYLLAQFSSSYIEEGLKALGFWKSNPQISDSTFMGEFYSAIFASAITRINICPMKSPTHNRPSENDFGIRDVKSLLELAWAELFIANINRIKFSICPCCGKTYSLEGKGNWHKMTCGNNECKVMFRRETDKRNRRLQGDEIREKERIRQERYRAIRAIISQKSTVEEQAKKLNIPTVELENWLNDYKTRQKKRNK